MISLKQGSARLPLPQLPQSRSLLAIAAVLALGVGGIALRGMSASKAAAPPPAPQAAPVLQSVTALGRLEPDGEIISVAPATPGEGSRLEELRVKVGDTVKQGAILAVLNSRSRLQAALTQAEAQEQTARAKLAQVQAGAKTGEIQAQRSEVARMEAERTGDLNTQSAVVARLEAELAGDINTQSAAIARLEAELANAKSEAGRYQQLYDQGAVSESLRDSKRLVAQTVQTQLQEAQAALERTRAARRQQINEAVAARDRSQAVRSDQIDSAESTLDRIAEVRPVDLAAAQAEVAVAASAVAKAQAELEQAYVRAPQDGTILKLHTRPGEKLAPEGVVDLGRTAQMVAVVEVYESDVRYLRSGQKAQVVSDALGSTTPLQGRVIEIGRKVLRQNVVNTDPTVNTDSRVVEVRIQLDPDSSKQVAQFTNSQVTAKILLE